MKDHPLTPMTDANLPRVLQAQTRQRVGLISYDTVVTGAVFIPFAFYEAAANLLTNPTLEPIGKIAEVKCCAVRLAPSGQVTSLVSFGGGQSFEESMSANKGRQA